MKLTELTVGVKVSGQLIEILDTIADSMDRGSSESIRHLSYRLSQELTSYNSDIQTAVNNIAPWIAASLSEDCCKEYQEAADALLSFAEVNHECQSS